MIYTNEMLESKIEDECIIDLFWYCADEDDYVAVIASAGGLIPNSVIKNQKDQNHIIKYFCELPEINDEIVLQQIVTDEIMSMNATQRSNYLKYINIMVSRGLYFFDKKKFGDYFDFEYYLKAAPKTGLKLANLSEPIIALISQTKPKLLFKDTNSLFVDRIE